MEILDSAEPIGQLSQLVIMRREECLGASVGVDVLDGRRCHRRTVICRRAASNLVEQDQ